MQQGQWFGLKRGAYTDEFLMASTHTAELLRPRNTRLERLGPIGNWDEAFWSVARRLANESGTAIGGAQRFFSLCRFTSPAATVLDVRVRHDAVAVTVMHSR
jgi:hypothetical protein